MEIIHIRHDEVNINNNEYVVAIGNFDGIHQGHRHVIKKAARIARDKKLKLGVMCFDVTPRQIVNNIENYSLLRSFEQKKEILKELGVDTIFLIHFNNYIKNLSAKEFVQNIIITNNIKYLICGYDFVFGKNKQGDIKLLEEYTEFKTVILPRCDYNHKKIGSTMIHEMITYGDVEQANELLVRPYSIIGTIIEGNKKGRTIGFPTANLLPIINYRIPQTGVYATRIIIDENNYLGMTNIGHNPTFNFTNKTSIEVNIFDFDKDIYNHKMEIIFEKYIRKERIFDSVSDLVKQLHQDKQEIIDYFDETSH